MAANNKKFDVKEYIRTTSVGCVKEPQANALLCLQNGDLRSFTDIVNTEDVEALAMEADHWINLPVDGDLGDRGNLLDIAVEMDKSEFVSVLVSAGARCDLVAPSSGFAPPHKAAIEGNVNILRLLIGEGDDIDPNLRSSDRHGGWTPLHFSAGSSTSGHLACLNLLLQQDGVDVDAKDTRGVQTPLFLAVKAKNEEAVRALLENGANLDVKCGRSTIREYLAEMLPEVIPAKIRVKKTREVMLNLKDKMFDVIKATKRGGNNYSADLASFKTFARFIRSMNEQDSLNEVFDLACEKGLDEHVKILLKKGVNPNTPGKPILEVAFHGFYNVLKVLKVDGRSNFRITNHRTKETILHCVLKKEFKGANPGDYEKCLDVLLDSDKKDLFRQMSDIIDNKDVSKQMKAIINKRDDLDNTALHYATQKWSQQTVRKLLEFGANIGIKNHWKELPISRIRPETMESFLDEFCLSYSGDVVHEDFSLTFHYDFLAPDIEALPEKYRMGAEDTEDGELLKGRKGVVHALPETESLWYMGQSKQHRHLLKHPVITSFLWYKWERIRRTFNRNLRFYILFVYVLTWYIFENIGGEANTKSATKFGYGLFILVFIAMLGFILRDWIGDIKDYQRSRKMEGIYKRSDNSCCLFANLIISNWFEAIFITAMAIIAATHPSNTSNQETIPSSPELEGFTTTSLDSEEGSNDSSVLKWTLTGLLVVLVFRELVQMSVSLKRYILSFENWLEMAMIVLISAMLYNEGGDPDVTRHLAAISIVLSWAELITLIGKHPKLNRCNIYVTMFYKVLKTFFLFLSWYSLFIIAFGLGFYILLHKTGEEEEGDYVFFNKPWLSLVKTASMFIGELEFSDIPINLNSSLAPLSYLFFLAFVFLIVVVLMNLLNGLAVSDTGAIQDKAEIYSHLSRVETISHLESVMLGDPFDFLSNVPAMFSSVPSCSVVRQLYRSHTLGRFFTKISSTGILLFYNYLPDKSITIRPNKNTQDCSCLSYDEMGRDIVASAKDIVMKREQDLDILKLGKSGYEGERTSLDAQLMDRIGKIELQLAALSKMDIKMDQILVKLNRL